MSLSAISTKERYNELRKNPLVFGKIEKIYDYAEDCYKMFWTSCDKTIAFKIVVQDSTIAETERILFVAGDLINDNNKVEEQKDGNDKAEFELVEFNTSAVLHWQLVFEDCLYNYNSGNSRHCHMTLFWALYTTSWTREVIGQVISQSSPELLQVVCSYINANIFILAPNKQYVLVEILKTVLPNIQPLGVPEIDAALKELAPSFDFSDYGLYQKVDFILNFKNQSNGPQHLEKLYGTSLNGFIHFIYWVEHPGHTFFNYSFLEFVYSCVSPLEQLSIVKRYLHDVRLNLTEIDFLLLQNLRDIRYQYQSLVDIRYFITKPGDNIELVAPLFCDTLLTLKDNNGERLQSFNGILDFAVRQSNRGCPQIDLGVKHFLPCCDGGLMHNPSFRGFIHYALIHTFDESKLSEENLKVTAEFLIGKFANLQHHFVCRCDNDRVLSPEILVKCNGLQKKRGSNSCSDEFVREKCSELSYVPIVPYVWKIKPEASSSILNYIIDNIESKESVSLDDVNYESLKQFLLRWGQQHNSFSFINEIIPEDLKKDDVALHMIKKYYGPSAIKIYPNDDIFYSSRCSLLDAWSEEDPMLNSRDTQSRKGIIQNKESAIVYKRTFDSLKKKFPDAEIGEDYVKLPYNSTNFRDIKAYYYYSNTGKDQEFLCSKRIHGVFYCTPKLADNMEQISNLPYFFCRSDECFRTMLGNQTLEKQSDWKKYTLYHAAEILGYKLIEVTEKGNVPVEAVLHFAGEVTQAEKLYSRLICRSCGHMIFSSRGTLLNGSRFFKCFNYQCSKYDYEVYLSQCNHCKKGLIDSRDSKRCENGWVVCPSCLACCNDALFDRLIQNHQRNGWVPPRLQAMQNKGHNNRNIFFCPECGGRLGDISREEKVILEDGTEIINQFTVLGCSYCNKSYEKEKDKYVNV